MKSRRLIVALRGSRRTIVWLTTALWKGSDNEGTQCPLWVRNRHVQCSSLCLLRANSGLMQRSKKRSLFDHLVSEAEQFGWHFNAKRFGGFGIDGHVKF